MADLPPPPDIIRSAYAELAVTSLADARHFWVDLLGFVVTAQDASALYLRGYDELTHHNLVLRAGPVAALRTLAFRVRSAADLARAEHFYRALGCPAERVPAGATRGIGEQVRVQDPLGFPVSFFAAADHAERLQQRYDLRRGAEVARLDHFNICVPDVPAAYRLYSSLGFGLSETIEDGQTLYAAWMYRKQTVHDVAFTGGAGPRLHHLGFFAHEPHSVLRMCDILGATGDYECIERGRAGTACRTRSTCTCATPTGTAWRYTPPITTPATRTTRCCAGPSWTRVGETFGGMPSSPPGTARHRRSLAWMRP